jgi:hypothetical protein
MSWLRYGLNEQEELIPLEAVTRGKTSLVCPYCQGSLTAKKGKIKNHHFAHTEQTCAAVERRTDLPTLPLYDNFNLRLSGSALQELKTLWEEYGVHNWSVPSPENKSLLNQQLLKFNDYRGFAGGYESTKRGKIPMGALSLMLFNQVQEPMLLRKLQKLE